MKFTLLEEAEIPEGYFDPPEAPPHRQVQCLCGRFAKWSGDRHYYNGSFNCYSFDVDCSRCGVVTIECV